MDRKEILTTAEKMVSGARQDDYGKPENSFAMIAELWSIYLKYRQRITGIHLTVRRRSTEGIEREIGKNDLRPEDVAVMMILLKIARVAGGHGKSDNWVDIAGYAACGGEVQSATAEMATQAGDAADAAAAVIPHFGESTPDILRAAVEKRVLTQKEGDESV